MNSKLCNKESQLKKSHIIPEFLYSSMYDEKHRFHVLSSFKATKNAKLQKGIREPLLCEECENKLSKYERYISLVFTGATPIKSTRDGGLIIVEGLDYKKFKLFALSVLWRASVSTLPFFTQVNLGPHEEVIRQMIHNEEPGEIEAYPFMLSPVVFENEVQTDLIIQPSWARLQGLYSYRFVFGGIVWVYVVSSQKPPDILLEATLSLEGRMTMLEKDITTFPFIMDFISELKQNGKLQ